MPRNHRIKRWACQWQPVGEPLTVLENTLDKQQPSTSPILPTGAKTGCAPSGHLGKHKCCPRGAYPRAGGRSRWHTAACSAHLRQEMELQVRTWQMTLPVRGHSQSHLRTSPKPAQTYVRVLAARFARNPNLPQPCNHMPVSEREILRMERGRAV